MNILRPVSAVVTFFLYSVALGLVALVLTLPHLDSFIPFFYSGVAIATLLCLLVWIWSSKRSYRPILSSVGLVFFLDTLVALATSRLWINVYQLDSFPPNILAIHYGWAGDMADDALFMEVFFLTIAILCAVELMGYFFVRSKA
jgi:hypothetical protein